MKGIETAAPLVPVRPTIRKLQIVAAACKACHLWKAATQTVFGKGKQRATVMFIGEQPDREPLPRCVILRLPELRKRRRTAKDLRMRCMWPVLRILRSFAALQDDTGLVVGPRCRKRL
ncbi:MAG: hypothetical protein M3P29_02270 [Acidobacteriota bacterium]|nr:hypothetical protein [Acidobacteriota bacterium]